MTYSYICLAWLLVHIPFAYCVPQQQSSDQELALRNTDQSIRNKIDIWISNSAYNSVKAVKGNKINLKKPILKINEKDCEVKDLHTHGNTTLYLRRKSFNFHLDAPAHFLVDDKRVKLKKFDAISLSMDKLYMRNRIAFELMEKLRLFNMTYTYSDLSINDNHEGIYMIIEHPKEWAIKKKDAPFVIRRGYDHRIEKQYARNSLDKNEVKEYKNKYNQIYKSIKSYQGEELYNQLSTLLDLDMYLRWLAFNFFIKNTDYTDEVFFYISEKEQRYKIIPWDYDDIFGKAPHEGFEERNKKIGDRLVFSSEDLLDQKIANDQFLYSKYLKQLNHVLLELNEEVLTSVFQHTYAELYPYYAQVDIISMSEHDAYKNANLQALEVEMKVIYKRLVESRLVYLNSLEAVPNE